MLSTESLVTFMLLELVTVPLGAFIGLGVRLKRGTIGRLRSVVWYAAILMAPLVVLTLYAGGVVAHARWNDLAVPDIQPVIVAVTTWVMVAFWVAGFAAFAWMVGPKVPPKRKPRGAKAPKTIAVPVPESDAGSAVGVSVADTPADPGLARAHAEVSPSPDQDGCSATSVREVALPPPASSRAPSRSKKAKGRGRGTGKGRARKKTGSGRTGKRR